MLEKVDSAGLIALGKRFAGQLFNVHLKDDGVLVLEPMTNATSDAQAGRVDEVAKTDAADRWLEENRTRIEAYNAWADQRPSFSASVHAWRRARAEVQPDQSDER